jgi:osmoprotectant transport system permease protein
MGVAQRETASIIALVLLGLPPLLAGTYAGVHQIPRSVIDAARAQGMTERQILFTVEAPLSLPLVLGGLRGAVLQIVATATLVAYVGLGGLGYAIIQGIPLRRFDQTVGSALVIVGLALTLDAVLALATKLVTPRGVVAGRLEDVRARETSQRLDPVTTAVASPPRKETREKEHS